MDDMDSQNTPQIDGNRIADLMLVIAPVIFLVGAVILLGQLPTSSMVAGSAKGQVFIAYSIGGGCSLIASAISLIALSKRRNGRS